MFTDLLNEIKRDVVSVLSKLEVQELPTTEALEEQRRKETAVRNVQFLHPELAGAATIETPIKEQADTSSVEQTSSSHHQPFTREYPKVGRNDACPCQSGKKYKHCHGTVS